MLKAAARFIAVEVLLKSILLCLVTTFLVYLLLSLTPRSGKQEVPIRYSETPSPQTLQPRAATPGFPLFYGHWLGSVCSGKFGRILAGQDIAEEITTRAKTTFALSFFAIIPALLVSLLLGVMARKPRSPVYWGGITLYLLATLPAFLLGYFLYGLFGSSFLVAALTLGLSCGIINEMSRIVRHAIEVENSKDYMETARAKGLRQTTLPWPGTLGFHPFRHALITSIPQINLLFTLVISGSMVVEQVFRLPGLSYMLMDGLTDQDTGRILVVVLLSVLLVRSSSLLANFLYLVLNPRANSR